MTIQINGVESNTLVTVDVAVIGGGIAGLAAAAAASITGRRVLLIEAGGKIGGLLASRDLGEMGMFDWGTHVLHETGDRLVDEVLFNHLTSENGWNEFKSCPNATFFKGSLCRGGFVDARQLGPTLHDSGLNELIALPPPSGTFHSLQDQLEQTYGRTFRTHVFEPILQKLFGTTSVELIPRAHELIGLKRLICGTPEQALRLKHQSPWVDQRLAFHETACGARPVRFLYPRFGGIGRWVEDLQKRLSTSGCEFLLNEIVVELLLGGNQIQIKTGSQSRVLASQVVWTVSPGQLLKTAGKEVVLRDQSVKFCQTDLVDMMVRGPVIDELMYVTCYEPSLQTFRVTLYDNLQRTASATRSRLTIEVMRPPASESETPTPLADPKHILEELKLMGVVKQTASLEWSKVHRVHKSFPIPTIQSDQTVRDTAAQAAALSKHIRILGRASGRQFFTDDVLREAFRLFQQPLTASPEFGRSTEKER